MKIIKDFHGNKSGTCEICGSKIELDPQYDVPCECGVLYNPHGQYLLNDQLPNYRPVPQKINLAKRIPDDAFRDYFEAP